MNGSAPLSKDFKRADVLGHWVLPGLSSFFVCYLISNILAGEGKNFIVKREEVMQPPLYKNAVLFI